MNKDYNFIVKITTSCPGNCKCCVNRQKNFKFKNNNFEFFDIDVFKKICINIKKLGGSYICISGGEPTIVSNLDEYINIAHQEGLATRINTNGWNVTEENLERWLNLGLDQIVLSIYGTDESTVLKSRGNKKIFTHSMNALSAIKKLRQKYNFIFIMQTIIMKDTYKILPDILKLAIDSNADLFWPSYLEDAINLPEIRMEKEEILYFKKNIIPKMKKVISNSKLDTAVKSQLQISLEQYYSIDYDDYIYHSLNCSCHWLGKHFTFYPNGVVDPCPGHEYFTSEYQYKVNYEDIDKFMSIENLESTNNICFEYCKYCPQGEHKELLLRKKSFHEHSRKEDLV